MVALKWTFHNEAYEEATEAFAYTVVVLYVDWDLRFLGDHLADQIAACVLSIEVLNL